jgi:hypothetical protein
LWLEVCIFYGVLGQHPNSEIDTNRVEMERIFNMGMNFEASFNEDRPTLIDKLLAHEGCDLVKNVRCGNGCMRWLLIVCTCLAWGFGVSMCSFRWIGVREVGLGGGCGFISSDLFVSLGF